MSFRKGDLVCVVRTHCEKSANKFVGLIGTIYISHLEYSSMVCMCCGVIESIHWTSVVEFAGERRFVIPHYALKKFEPPKKEAPVDKKKELENV